MLGFFTNDDDYLKAGWWFIEYRIFNELIGLQLLLKLFYGKQEPVCNQLKLNWFYDANIIVLVL